MGQETKSSPRKAAKNAERKFANKIHDYAESHAASSSDLGMFKDALGYGRLCNTMLASDLRLRRKASHFLAQGLRKLRNACPELEFQFWTLTHEQGNTSDRTPTIDLKFLRSQTDKTLRKQGLDGVYVIEVQGLGNYPAKGNGRLIMVHVHALTWSVKPLNFEAVEDELNSGSMWKNSLGALPVRVKPVTDADGELEYLSYYLFKPPYDAKMVEKRKRGERLKSTEKGYKPEFAARMLELLSQLEITELVRSSCEGKFIRREWQRRLINWHRSRERWSGGKLPNYYFDDLWDRYRTKKKKKEYAPFTIIR